MKRIVNHRPLCFFVLAQSIGILIGAYCFQSKGAVVAVISVATVVLVAMFLLKQKKLLYLPIAFVVGFMGIYCSYQTYIDKSVNAKNVQIQGTICSEITKYKTTTYFEISDVYADGQKLSKKARVYCSQDVELSPGDRLLFKGNISTNTFDISDGVFVSAYHNGVYYDVSSNNIQVAGKGTLSKATSFRLSFYEKLDKRVDGSSSDIVKALVFGDKFAIDAQLYDDIKSSGLAHLLAVSGLHIGIIGGALFFLFSKLGIKRWYKFGTITTILLLYGWLCGFPSSVIRAIVLCSTFMLAECLGRKYDALSTLGLAGIIDLLIFPTDLFSVGCIMSFASVLGIIVLFKPLTRKREAKPSKVLDILSVSIAVNIMLFPIMAYFFGQFQTLFLISNVLLLPIIAFIYIISLLIMLFVQIMPFLSPTLGLDVCNAPHKACGFYGREHCRSDC